MRVDNPKELLNAHRRHRQQTAFVIEFGDVGRRGQRNKGDGDGDRLQLNLVPPFVGEALLDAGGKHQGSAAGFGDHLVEQGLHLVDGEALPGVSGDDLGKRPRLRQFRGVGHRRDQKREPSRDQGKREMLEPMRGAL